MAKNKLVQHFNDLHSDFLKFYKKTSKDQGVEDIHQLRVAIKKIRALLSLIELAGNGEFQKKEHFDLFKNLFRKAGKVREIQVNLSLIKKIDQRKSKLYVEYLIELQNHSMEELMNELLVFDLKKLKSLNAQMLSKANEISPEHLTEKSTPFISSKFQKIKKLRDKIKKDQKLHKIRIHLKAVVELVEYLPYNKENKSLKKEIKRLNQLIGDWHDNIVLLNTINQYHKTINSDKKNKQLVKRLKLQNKKSKINIGELLHLLPNRI